MRIVNIITLLVLLTPGLQAQDMNRVAYDTTLKADILLGPCDRVGLESFGGFAQAFIEGFHGYQPEQKYVGLMPDKLDGVSITIVLGVWCSDSKEQVPRAFKVLEMAGYPLERINLIAVDRKKKAEGTQVEELNIERVPTFIIYRNGKEAGRIIETPKVSIEADLLEILQRPPDVVRPAPNH